MPRDLSDLVNIFLRLLSLILPIIFALSVLVFFWGLLKFILKAGDVKSHEEGKAIMKWGLIIIFVMLSLMMILWFFSVGLGFGPTIIPLLPI